MGWNHRQLHTRWCSRESCLSVRKFGGEMNGEIRRCGSAVIEDVEVGYLRIGWKGRSADEGYIPILAGYRQCGLSKEDMRDTEYPHRIQLQREPPNGTIQLVVLFGGKGGHMQVDLKALTIEGIGTMGAYLYPRNTKSKGTQSGNAWAAVIAIERSIAGGGNTQEVSNKESSRRTRPDFSDVQWKKQPIQAACHAPRATTQPRIVAWERTRDIRPVDLPWIVKSRTTLAFFHEHNEHFGQRQRVRVSSDIAGRYGGNIALWISNSYDGRQMLYRCLIGYIGSVYGNDSRGGVVENCRIIGLIRRFGLKCGDASPDMNFYAVWAAGVSTVSSNTTYIGNGCKNHPHGGGHGGKEALEAIWSNGFHEVTDHWWCKWFKSVSGGVQLSKEEEHAGHSACMAVPGFIDHGCSAVNKTFRNRNQRDDKYQFHA
ncbi:uncharacterized protein EI90DRAFT_3287605 [Cantharellus anzutake]|uniref:uncharacterized protein n=1 Tax=Cantharellus anzutake TaxID=1750568 RepID=UPI001905B80C|nr:uncharacterized protein EI90DRAFT_3287605 [Cantharellus anzutake]KAF8336594.1 hypothetical protein EI90DRAFT_3287605 [Cantharellus anzutake]